MILVIGATGKVGAALIRELCTRKARVRALVRDPRKARAITALGAEAVLGDLKLPETLEPALDGVRRIFLLSPPDPQQVELHTNLLRRASPHPIEVLVRMSAMGARADSDVGILRWHGAAEQQLLATGIPHVNLRGSSFMQNLLASAPSIRDEGKFYGCQGDARLSLVDAEDIGFVAAALLLAPAPRERSVTMDVTGPKAITAQEQASILTRTLGRTVEYVDLPPHLAHQGMVAQGLPSWLADDLVAIAAEQAGGVNATVTDVVQRIGGKEPTTFEQFVEANREAFGG